MNQPISSDMEVESDEDDTVEYELVESSTSSATSLSSSSSAISLVVSLDSQESSSTGQNEEAPHQVVQTEKATNLNGAQELKLEHSQQEIVSSNLDEKSQADLMKVELSNLTTAEHLIKDVIGGDQANEVASEDECEVQLELIENPISDHHYDSSASKEGQTIPESEQMVAQIEAEVAATRADQVSESSVKMEMVANEAIQLADVVISQRLENIMEVPICEKEWQVLEALCPEKHETIINYQPEMEKSLQIVEQIVLLLEIGQSEELERLEAQRARPVLRLERPEMVRFEKEASELDKLDEDGWFEQGSRVCICDTGELSGNWAQASNMLASLEPIKAKGQLMEMSEQNGQSSELNLMVRDPWLELEEEEGEAGSFERRELQVKIGRRWSEEYVLEEELGRGKFGTVFRCRDLNRGAVYAAKFVQLQRKEGRKDVMREIEIMSKLQHRRLLQLCDAFDDLASEMCLITELVEGGELFDRIVDDDFELTEEKAAVFMRQICEGVHYMHSQKIVHLDMKPENILCVSRTGFRVKLIDFGLARQLEAGQPLRVMFGTPDFAAPEVLAYETVSLATDMWSVGVICYVLLSGLSPFMGDNDLETMANVTRAIYDFDERAFEPISGAAKDFIARLLVRNQADRLPPERCLEHPWLQRSAHRNLVHDETMDSCLEQAQSDQADRSDSARVEHEEDSWRLSVWPLKSGRRRKSMAPQTENQGAEQVERSLTLPLLVSLDKRNLKRYVVRRKWHRTVHAIMALGRMGANLKLKPAV